MKIRIARFVYGAALYKSLGTFCSLCKKQRRNEEKMNQKLFSKDFILVIIGQIISLFGNATIRFALPLYLLNQTGSSVIYGNVTACAFIPAILLSPVGGILADRVNKRNVMVILDFFTAISIFVFSLLFLHVNLILVLTIMLMLLYSIAGIYQPSVQASIPALVSQSNYMAANSIVNVINSFATLIGPIFGGILYSTYGLQCVLWVCMVCFVLSAIMELFIKIPFIKQDSNSGICRMAIKDFSESIQFIRKEKPVIGKVLLVVCGINLFLSAMIMVGMPYIITEVLNLGELQVNKLLGYAEGMLAAGGLIGGICTGIFANKLVIKRAGILIIVCALFVFPMGVSLLLFSSGFINYLVMILCGFMIMIFSTVFAVQMLSFVQVETPQHLIGKVMSVVLTISMCAQPLGNALYGILFEWCEGIEWIVILFAGFISLIIAIRAKNIFVKMSLKEK